MSDPSVTPDCTIEVKYDATASPPFSYALTGASTNCRQGWSMQGGHLYTPVLSKLIRFALPDLPSTSELTGFQIGKGEDHFPDPGAEPWHVSEGLSSHGVTLPTEPTRSLQVDLTNVPASAFPVIGYRLCIDGNWDDPKIYDNGG